MSKRKTLVLLIVLFSCKLIIAENKIENNNISLKQSIIKVVRAFKYKDTATLNNMIYAPSGLIVLFRRGTFDEYGKTDRIDFNAPVPGYLPYFDFNTDYKVRFESVPTFDCNKMKWSRKGLFCDSLKADNLLSTTAKNLKKYRGDSISENEIKAFVELEKNSRRIVLSDGKKGELVFYLTLINNKWYLTIIDRVTSDCSA